MTSSKIAIQQQAQTYVDAGFAVIPLNGKIPVYNSWHTVKPQKDYDVTQLQGNYGVVLRAEDLIIDIDPRNFTEGDNPVARLSADVGGIPASYTVKTGGGGLHIYLRKPAGIKVVNALREYPGIEFKSLGRQVAGPGSIHPSTGGPYSVVKGNVTERAKAPDSLVYLIMRKQDISQEANGLSSYTDDEHTTGRFITYLKKIAPVAEQGCQGDITTFKVACHGKELGLSPNVVTEMMLAHWNSRCTPPWDPADMAVKVKNAYRYSIAKAGSKHPAAEFDAVEQEEKLSWVLSKNGGPVKCFVNALNFLKSSSTGLKGVFGYNEFTGGVEFVGPAPWHNGRLPSDSTVTDNELKLFKAYLAVKHGFEIPIALLDEVIVAAAYLNTFHPVRSYVKSLEWDGVKRLDFWLHKYANVKLNPYTAAVGRKLICAMVARIMKPGCKFDYMPVLEGKQGIGKSRLCEALGGEWYGDLVLDPHSRDTVAAMQNKWLIEMSEMEVTKRAETQALKAFISRRSDKARLAFQRNSREFPRQCVFVGTINPEADGSYLKDNTGNRRFWCITVGKVDVDGIRAIRHQLFAEALEAYEAGEQLHLAPDVEKIAAMEAEKRLSEHPWTERILQWLNSPDGAALVDFITPRTVFIQALGGTERSYDRLSAAAICNIFQRIGWDKGIRQENGISARGYIRPKIESLESIL